MALDLHVPNEGHVTLRIRDQSRRSDTAKRHQLLRQRRVEEGEGPPFRDTNSCSPRLPGNHILYIFYLIFIYVTVKVETPVNIYIN